MRKMREGNGLMVPGTSNRTDHVRIDPKLIARFSATPSAILSDNLARLLGDGGALRLVTAAKHMAGTAFTVRTRPNDNLFVHKALDLVQPGDVLVVDAGGDVTHATMGEIMLEIAISKRVGGIVIDGAIRDIEAFQVNGMPVFAKGTSHRGPYKDGPGEIGCDVKIGEMVVHPGDLVVGDADGLIAVRPSELDALIVAAEAQMAREAGVIASIKNGTVDRAWVDKTLKERGYI